MKEDFLHYLWKFQKFKNLNSLQTTNNLNVEIVSCGRHNTENSGPDFFNAQLIIDHQKWAGNVEIHIKSSDWYAHNHQNDAKYDSVILHVVWEHDVDIYRSDNSPIATLELKNNTPAKTIEGYHKLLNNPSHWINCSNQLKTIAPFTIHNWLERLYIERLHSKSKRISVINNQLKNDWEATCFSLIAQYFGGNKNGKQFLAIAKSIPFNILQKTTSVLQLEALLFGQANLLQDPLEDAYYIKLQQEYNYLKHKHKLIKTHGFQLEFFRLRPANFPTIRLAQLAYLITNHKQLFSLIINEFKLSELKKILKTSTSAYWKTHYAFGKESKKSIKTTSDAFIELLIINAIIPLQFYYNTTINKEIDQQVLLLISALRPEKNTITTNFKKEQITIENALHSQALLQLKKEYCDPNLCLKCAVGFELLKGK